tara:strand:- start:1642 stop:3897 length:2256 start_codon:yes stop_codon:yes gene_type:complete
MALGIVAKGLLGAGKVVGKGVGLAGRGAMMAGRTGMALRGRKKKINTSKLMGREGGEEKGGALAIRPSSNIVSSPGGAIQKIEKTEETGSKGNTLLVIKTKLVSIDTILKGTLAAEKKAEDVKRKAQERSERKEDEKELEDDSKEGKKAQKFKLAPPKQVLSFWEKIKSFFGKVLFGWLAVRLIDWLPKLMPILKFLAGFADFIIKVGGFLLNALITFVDWGYKAVSATRGFVKNLFGEKGAKAFDGITKHLTTLFNIIGSIALGVLAFGNQANKQKQKDLDKRTKGNKKLKDRYDRRQKFKQQQKRIQRKKFFKKRTPKALRKTIQRGKITAKKFTRSLKKTPQKLTKSLSKNVGKVSQSVGKNLSKVSGKISQSAGKIVTRLGMKMNTGMVQSMKGISKMAKGVRIPIIGPILAALTSYLADGKLDKALFIGIGTALGEMLGTAIPIPVVGTLLGGAIGFYIGDLLYTLFRGGGIGAVLNKLKEDLKKVFNVGKAVGKWAGTGFARFYEGIPKVLIPDFPKEPPKWIPGWVPRKKALWNIAKTGLKVLIGPLSLLMGKKIPILPWLMNPFKTTPLLIKSFFSRDPIKEKVFDPVKAVSSFFKGDEKKDKKDKAKDKDKKDNKKLDKIFKMNGKEYDLSQSMGGLSREEYDSLSRGESSRLNSRLRVYANQNKEEWVANIMKGNDNNRKKISSVEAYASYENGGEEVIVIPPQENTETTSQPEKGTVYPVMVGSGSGGSDEISARLYERG